MKSTRGSFVVGPSPLPPPARPHAEQEGHERGRRPRTFRSVSRPPRSSSRRRCWCCRSAVVDVAFVAVACVCFHFLTACIAQVAVRRWISSNSIYHDVPPKLRASRAAFDSTTCHMPSSMMQCRSHNISPILSRRAIPRSTRTVGACEARRRAFCPRRRWPSSGRIERRYPRSN